MDFFGDHIRFDQWIEIFISQYTNEILTVNIKTKKFVSQRPCNIAIYIFFSRGDNN